MLRRDLIDSSKAFILATAVALLVTPASPAGATPAEDRREILGVIQQFFDALAARSPERVMALVAAEGTLTAHATRRGISRTHSERWREWADGLRQGNERLEEVMHAPEVRVRGNMASVWAQYSFRIDGRFSHCGVDNFDMARIDGRWRIVNLSFTVETEGCRRR